MSIPTSRENVRFDSGGTDCAAWVYRGTSGAAIVMAGGFGVTKEPGTDAFAQRFHTAGYTVVAFDYRRIGESGGAPRQVLPLKDQLADWAAALRFTAALPGVDPARIALWAFSMSGGHVLRVAAEHPELVAAVIAQSPFVDGRAASRTALRHQSPRAMARFVGRGLLDAFGGRFGRAPLLVPLSGERGTVAVVTSPDSLRGDEALNPGNRYPDWVQAVAARSTLAVGFYRPGRAAASITCPLLVVVGDDDQVAPPEAAVAVSERAPRGELLRVPGGHYAPFLEAHEQVVAGELEFLDRIIATEN
jgi:pimeloyl-ACP methyl ester carboxylesterase